MSEAITFHNVTPGNHTGGACALCGRPIHAWDACVQATDHLATGTIVVLLHLACRAELVLPISSVAQ